MVHAIPISPLQLQASYLLTNSHSTNILPLFYTGHTPSYSAHITSYLYALSFPGPMSLPIPPSQPYIHLVFSLQLIVTCT